MVASRPKALKERPPALTDEATVLSQRKKPTQLRARTTVQRIFKATEDLVRARGFARVGTRQIAARAGISVGSVYQYFPTYEAILLAWYEEVAASAARKMLEATIDVLDMAQSDATRITATALLVALEKHSLVLLEMPAEMPEIERAISDTSFLHLNRAAMRRFFERHREYDSQDTERHIFLLETLIMALLRRWVIEKPRAISRTMMLQQVCGLIEGYLDRNRLPVTPLRPEA